MEYLKAFIIGGLMCIPAQILLDKTKLTNARILTIYVVSGVILSSVNLYSPLVEYASAGATVPLTGFGYALVNGVKDSIDSKGFLGIISGGISGAAAGISTAILIGFLCSLFFKSKQK